MFDMHSEVIAAIAVPSAAPHNIFTASLDCTIRCLDAIANRQLKNERLFAMEKLAYEKMAGGFNAHLLPGADAATFTDAITNASSKWALRMAELYQPDSYEKEMQAILLT